MTPEDVTIICPTKGRQDLATKLLNSIPHRPFIFMGTDPQDFPENYLDGDYCSIASERGVAQAIQQGILWSKTKLFVQTCDDVQVEPGWLEEALRVYNEAFGPEGDGVVSINNCHPPDIELATFPLMSKRFYMELCYPVPYEHYFIDADWTFKARLLGRYAYAEKAIMRHCHAGPQDDEVKNADRKLFFDRMDKFMEGKVSA